MWKVCEYANYESWVAGQCACRYVGPDEAEARAAFAFFGKGRPWYLTLVKDDHILQTRRIDYYIAGEEAQHG